MTISQKYKQTREDFEFLETIKELDDWMSIEEGMLNLMQNPDKKTAMNIYDSAIRLWFVEHGINSDTSEIAEKYNIKS